MSQNMNTAADRDRRQRFGAQRGRDLYWGFTLGLLVYVATMSMISFGENIPKLTIIGKFIVVIVNSFH